MAITFNKDLVINLGSEIENCEQAERAIAAHLEKLGFVKDTYADAIVAREANFPTALDMQGLNIAIPHCDIEHVNSAAICMARLQNPVAWYKMDDPEETCEVQVVVMLALTEAHAQLDMLQNVIALIRDQDLVKRIIEAPSNEEAFELAFPHLIKE